MYTGDVRSTHTAGPRRKERNTMSMYQLTQGVNPATFFILPMLGKHPDEYPRFRDCFTAEHEWVVREDGFPVMSPKQDGRTSVICVFTRVGGNNRADYEQEIEGMRQMEGYLTDYDDAFDATYAAFVYAVPEQWKADYDLIVGGKATEVSAEYRQQLDQVYPKLKEKFAHLFSLPTQEEG